MKEATLPFISRLTSPNPVAIVCTPKPDGATNLATVSWWTTLSYNPEMIAFAMAKTAYSGERVRETGKVVLTVPTAPIAEEVLGCGTTTGRDTEKIEKFSIEMQQLEGCDIQVPVHSCVAVQCKMKEFIEAGDHYLYICDVEKVFANPDEPALFAWDGYSKIAPAQKA